MILDAYIFDVSRATSATALLTCRSDALDDDCLDAEEKVEVCAAIFRKAFAELPTMEIQHVRRINEALCDMEFPTPSALGLRRETLNQLARHHDLKKYRSVKITLIPIPKKDASQKP